MKKKSLEPGISVEKIIWLMVHIFRQHFGQWITHKRLANLLIGELIETEGYRRPELSHRAMVARISTAKQTVRNPNHNRNRFPFTFPNGPKGRAPSGTKWYVLYNDPTESGMTPEQINEYSDYLKNAHEVSQKEIATRCISLAIPADLYGRKYEISEIRREDWDRKADIASFLARQAGWFRQDQERAKPAGKRAKTGASGEAGRAKTGREPGDRRPADGRPANEESRFQYVKGVGYRYVVVEPIPKFHNVIRLTRPS